jgi:signal transduction histidine kinase
MFLDAHGSMWLGDRGDNEFGLFKYIENEKKFKSYSRDAADTLSLPSNEVLNIMEDDLGRMWVSTDGGVCLFDRASDVFLRSNKEFDIPSVRLREKAGNGKMWLTAYSGAGIALVGPGINDVEMFGENKGLLHNDASNLVLDDQGTLWITTQRGLSVFDTLSKTFSSYFERDGFQKYVRWNTMTKSKDGSIWIGGLNGLNHIIPANLFKKDSTVPEVLIASVGILDSVYSAPDGVIFEEAVSFSKKIELQYWQKDISFDFVALHYLRSEDNMYSWKLENYDKKWSTPSKERHISYTNLSPGKYIFRVKGSNADGIWNEEGASMEIVIAPPWWMTNLAYAVYALLVILIGLQVHKYQRAKTLRLAREKSQKKELEQAKEIEKAYTELKGTQAQLIQSEKMASLGELTAGIAHEIQNPLNFVNNFSEVNAELIEEMNEELEKGNLDEVKSLAKDIVENEKKIIQHGKRADDIVKGMLQHSRKSSGQKEPTNINDLMDEFIRLAYHGLRAKDKSFNASFETDFDNSIGEVNIVAQDIGRVILNLINNAFYAVNDRKKKEPEGYEPSVIVGTKKLGDHLELKISDNGLGIPSDIKDKIFQPFFTSKPTGEGTGLGLSLSYDIIKAHGGEIEVKSKENAGLSEGASGTEFTIVLPI